MAPLAEAPKQQEPKSAFVFTSERGGAPFIACQALRSRRRHWAARVGDWDTLHLTMWFA